MDYAWILFVAVVLLLLLFLPRWRMLLEYRHLPPGPFSWPLVGCLSAMDPAKGHLVLRDMAKKYGGIFSLYMGSRLVVVLDDWDAVKEAYSREEFLDRSNSGIFRAKDHVPNLIDMSGPPWKDHMSFQMNSFRNSGVGSRDLQDILLTQALEVVRILDFSEGDVNISHSIDLGLNNGMFVMIYGRVYDANHPLNRFLTEYGETIGHLFMVKNILLYFPWAKILFDLFDTKMNDIRRRTEKMDAIVGQEIEEHRRTLNVDEPRDYIDRFLIKMASDKADPTYNLEVLVENAKILLAAGSESTRTTLSWFFLLMAAYPDIQSRVLAEIDATLGSDREPSYEDRERLPFTVAAIFEGMRYRNIANLNDLREVHVDTRLQGLDIPKGSVLLQNVKSHFRKPAYFERPDEYDPTRFLSPDGTKLQVPDYFNPFSYGKRKCTGEKLAVTLMLLFSVVILQRFRVSPPEGGINLDVLYNFTNIPVHPYARFKRRV